MEVFIREAYQGRVGYQITPSKVLQPQTKLETTTHQTIVRQASYKTTARDLKVPIHNLKEILQQKANHKLQLKKEFKTWIRI